MLTDIPSPTASSKARRGTVTFISLSATADGKPCRRAINLVRTVPTAKSHVPANTQIDEAPASAVPVGKCPLQARSARKHEGTACPQTRARDAPSPSLRLSTSLELLRLSRQALLLNLASGQLTSLSHPATSSFHLALWAAQVCNSPHVGRFPGWSWCGTSSNAWPPVEARF